MYLYYVNYIGVENGKAYCRGFLPDKNTMEHVKEDVERVKANEENLACIWVTSDWAKPDGSYEFAGVPYIEVFVDAFGYPRLPQKIVNQRAMAKKPVKRMTAERPYETDVCPVCGQILMDERNDNFNFCPDCGQSIDWGIT